MILWTALAIVAIALTVWSRRFRNWLVSTRTAIALLVIVAVLSMLGVVVGQNLPLEAYEGRYGPLLGRTIAALGVADIFHTWYYIFFLSALTYSVLTCSFVRLFPRRRSARLGRLSVVGSLVTHLSIAVILAGGLMTAVGGFRRPTPEFLAAGDEIDVPDGGFSLRVDSARMEIAETGAVRDYVSEVTVIVDGTEALSKSIEVNHPLVYGGIGVYQYEMLPSATSIANVVIGVVLAAPAAEAGHSAVVARMAEEVSIPGTDFTLKPLEFLSDFTYDIERGTAELASLEHSNPAVLVQVLSNGRAVDESWLVAGFAGHEGGENLPFRMFLLDYTPDFGSALTRFELSRQPGTPLLFAGFGALSIGLCLTFWTRRPR